MSYLLYAANLHVGGGVQVAVSVISELSNTQVDLSKISVWASTTVDQNLRGLKVDTSCFLEYRVVDHRGIKAFFSADRRLMENFSCVLALFGPLYFAKLKTRTIVGFAQAWIISSKTEAYKLVSASERMFLRLKFYVQKYFFSLADEYVVELSHVKDGLLSANIGNAENIHVIHNCVSSIYSSPSLWVPVYIEAKDDELRIGYLGRNYAHKNTKILPNIKKLLLDRFGIRAQMFVTFTDEEWSSCSKSFKEGVVNVGPLSIAQCPSFYRQLDGVLFPSILECFSATPLEALAMERPLFASNRPFVRDICGDFAIYFDPMSPEDAALKIAEYFESPRGIDFLKLGRQHALNFSSPRLRALQYLELLNMSS